MPYKNLIRIFDERKRKLSALLEDDTVQLTDERTYQIKGAVDEIELFLLTLRQYNDQRIHKNINENIHVTVRPTLMQRLARVFQNEKKTIPTSSVFSLR